MRAEDRPRGSLWKGHRALPSEVYLECSAWISICTWTKRIAFSFSTSKFLRHH